MGFDNDCILNIQSLAGEYFCPVCHLLVYPNEALQAQCTHLYCKPCLTYVVSTTHACPYDGYRVTEADCKPLLESNKALADTIGKIQVHCLFYRTGCTWQGSLSDCSSHCLTCSYGESAVLCNRCGVQIVHRQVQEHAQNCPGGQSQAQQSGPVQDSTSTGALASADQSQTTVQAGLSASQSQTSQASAPLSGQDANQTANSGAQPQAAQAAMPTAEQWYQQQQQYQQQYQQYYQQYPGYDPYQQYYQHYYQYQQGVQQPQQPMQGYPPQAYGQAQAQVSGQAQAQAQAQVSGQAQAQSQLQGQQQVQPHSQPQPQQQPQAASQPAQPAINAQSQAQSVGQMQAQGQAPQSHALPYNQSQPLPQAQPYAQPQPQQQMQVPQYQQTHSQTQHPLAQTYPPAQTQTQHYPYAQPQSQVQPQPHSQMTMQAPARPPQHNQPINPNAQLQTHTSVTGYQSYPQPQPHPQAQVGAAHPMHVSGAQPQPQYPVQVQGKFPSQPSQYPPHAYSNVANQQQPIMPSAQGQPPSGLPAQQMPAYPHAQQPGYPFQQRPSVQAAHQAPPQHYRQQQSFPGHGPFVQQQQGLPGQLHAPVPPQTLQQPQQNYAPGYGAQPNIGQTYAARPGVAQGAGPQPHAQGAGFAGTGQARPMLQNQSYPIRADNQLSGASEQQVGLSQQTSRVTGSEKPHDQMLDKSIHDQNDPKREAGSSGTGIQMNDDKLKSESSLDGSVNGNESNAAGKGSKLLESDGQERKPRINGDASESVSEPSSNNSAAKSSSEDHKAAHKKAEAQDLKYTAGAPTKNLPQSHVVPQVHGTNSLPSVDQERNQLQPMHYGPTGQHRPGAAPMPRPMQPALSHPPGQLRPQGPGQVPPRPPFNSAENSQPSIANQLSGPHESASGANLGPGLSGPFARPASMGYHQGPPFPPHAQRPGSFDSHVGIEGRERVDVEQHPPFPMESEKFQSHRPGYFDGRKQESLSHGMERVSYGPSHQSGAMKFGGPSAHDPSGMRDERIKPFPEEHMKAYPQREFENDLRKFPTHFEAGPSSKYGTEFPSSGPLDHGPHLFGGDGMSRPFDKSQHGFDRDGLKMDSGVGSGPPRFLPPFHPNDGERGRAIGFPDDKRGRGDFGDRAEFSGPTPGPGFGRPLVDGLPPRSPGRDFSGFPPRGFGAYDDVGGNESRPFEGSRPYDFPAEPFGKSNHENRFPVPPNHFQRGELDVTGKMHMGEHLVGGPRNQDLLPNHLRSGEHMGPRNLHMGEPPLPGNFPQHIPFGDSFGGEKHGHPLVGEPRFRGSSGFQRYPREGGFYPDEMESFDNPRMWKVGGIMCRICKVECGTVDGLELHSQSREHQRKARDMVLSIKQQNKKKQRTPKGQAFAEGKDGGRPKNSSFQGRGNKR